MSDKFEESGSDKPFNPGLDYLHNTTCPDGGNSRFDSYTPNERNIAMVAYNAAWNARGKVDAEIADQDYGCEYVAHAIREEDV